jgi:MYXO-CTERM domain-containing protein
MLGPADLVAPFPAGTHAEVLASTIRVMLRHDPGQPDFGGSPVDAELGIDNVELAGPPQALPGDFDGNGRVDGGDLDHPTLGWRARFGVDLDGNDFLTWQRNLNVAAAPGGTTAPEPGSLSLVLVAAALAIRRPRSTRGAA